MPILAKILLIVSVAGIALMVLFGERTLFLFDGDRALAGRTYAALAMLLGSWFVAGASFYLFKMLANFSRTQTGDVLRTFDQGNFYHTFASWLQKIHITSVFEFLSVALPFFFLLAGVVMSIHIWNTVSFG